MKFIFSLLWLAVLAMTPTMGPYAQTSAEQGKTTDTAKTESAKTTDTATSITQHNYSIAGLPQQDFQLKVDYEHGTIEPVEFAGTVGFVIKPKDGVDPERRWVWISPLWLALPAKQGDTIARYYVDGILAHGYHVVGIDVGASLGSPKGAEIYQKFYEKLVQDYKLNRKARMIAVSNGGLITYGWAFRHPQHVDRIFGVYPVTDFRTWPKMEQVVGPGKISPAGLSYDLSPEEMQSRIKEFNIIDNLAPLAEAGVKIYHIHGDADELVPLEENSREFRNRYKELGGKMELEVLDGMGHGGTPFFSHQRALEFLLYD